MTVEELNSFNPSKIFGCFLISLREQFINCLTSELKSEITNPKVNFIFSPSEDKLKLNAEGYLEHYHWAVSGESIQTLIFYLPNHKTAVSIDINDFAGSQMFEICLDLNFKITKDSLDFNPKYVYCPNKRLSTEVLFSKECISTCSQWLLLGELSKKQSIFK